MKGLGRWFGVRGDVQVVVSAIILSVVFVFLLPLVIDHHCHCHASCCL